jgi:hypothetical protein
VIHTGKVHRRVLEIILSDAFQHKLIILAKIRVSVQAIYAKRFNTATAPLENENYAELEFC